MAMFVFFSGAARTRLISSDLFSPFWLLCVLWLWIELRLLGALLFCLCLFNRRSFICSALFLFYAYNAQGLDHLNVNGF